LAKKEIFVCQNLNIKFWTKNLRIVFYHFDGIQQIILDSESLKINPRSNEFPVPGRNAYFLRTDGPSSGIQSPRYETRGKKQVTFLKQIGTKNF